MPVTSLTVYDTTWLSSSLSYQLLICQAAKRPLEQAELPLFFICVSRHPRPMKDKISEQSIWSAKPAVMLSRLEELLWSFLFFLPKLRMLARRPLSLSPALKDLYIYLYVYELVSYFHLRCDHVRYLPSKTAKKAPYSLLPRKNKGSFQMSIVISIQFKMCLQHVKF